MDAHGYALLAQEAYSAKPDIGLDGSASQAIVRHTDDGLCIAFTGTENLDGWITDLDVTTVPVLRAGNIHRGFWLAWQAISGDVLKAIGDQPVTLVGHSLGAALSVMAAVTLTLAGKPPVAVYGFEPPRVSTDIAIRTLLAKVPVHLYKNGNDIVPDLPPGWPHAALLTHIGTALLPIPNVRDHAVERVIEALSAGSEPEAA
jgi:triacylglycerol lipase